MNAMLKIKLKHSILILQSKNISMSSKSIALSLHWLKNQFFKNVLMKLDDYEEFEEKYHEAENEA